MIKLYVFPRAFQSPNPGPFSIKVEMALRLLDIEYDICFEPDPRKGPKGKIPFIEYNGEKIADSELILNWLAATFDKDLDQQLSPLNRAQGVAFRALLEDRYYWSLVQSRWLNDDVFPVVRETFFGAMPWPLKSIVPVIAQRQVRRDLLGQGTSRLTREERIAIATKDVAAVAEQLGDNPWFFGDQPSRIDCSVYALMACSALPDFDTPLKAIVLSHSNIKNYINRISAECFGDLGLKPLA